MRIPKRPASIRTTLRRHAETPGAPVFVYRFPTPDEEVRTMFRSVARLRSNPEVVASLRNIEDPEARAAELNRILQEDGGQDGSAEGAYLCDLFDTQLITIEDLEIGDEPFNKELHLSSIPGEWKLEVAQEMRRRFRQYITGIEEGNSSSPLSSGDEATATTPDTGVAAANA